MAITCAIELLLANASLSDVLAYAAFIAEGQPLECLQGDDAAISAADTSIDETLTVRPTMACVYAPTWYAVDAAE